MLHKLIKARKVNKEHGISILTKYTDLVSVGVGHKTISGEDTKEPCILIGVLDKGSFPKGEKIPPEIGGIKTDIVQEDKIIAMSYPKEARQPMVGGISIGPSNLSSAGTLGCCVYHNALGTTKCGITNAHVLTYHNGMRNNGNQTLLCLGAVTGYPVQPGKLDPSPGLPVSVGYNLPYIATALSSGVDAALFVVSGSGVSITPNSILDIKLPIGLVFTPNNLQIGDSVTKSGRTTGVNTGTVQALDTTASINYTGCDSTNIVKTMTHLIKTSFMLSPGDSGSILLKNTTSKPVVGLCFAGSSTRSYACEWGNVQTVMGIHL